MYDDKNVQIYLYGACMALLKNASLMVVAICCIHYNEWNKFEIIP